MIAECHPGRSVGNPVTLVCDIFITDERFGRTVSDIFIIDVHLERTVDNIFTIEVHFGRTVDNIFIADGNILETDNGLGRGGWRYFENLWRPGKMFYRSGKVLW